MSAEIWTLGAAAAVAAWTAGFVAGAAQGRRAGRRHGQAEAALLLRERALSEAACPTCGARGSTGAPANVPGGEADADG
jgi:hypothetical protein